MAKLYAVKDARLVFLTPKERKEIEDVPLPPELAEHCCYFWSPANA